MDGCNRSARSTGMKRHITIKRRHARSVRPDLSEHIFTFRKVVRSFSPSCLLSPIGYSVCIERSPTRANSHCWRCSRSCCRCCSRSGSSWPKKDQETGATSSRQNHNRNFQRITYGKSLYRDLSLFNTALSSLSSVSTISIQCVMTLASN